MKDQFLELLNINGDNFKNVSQLIAGLATIAIVSRDLGVPYNKQEKKIYTSQLFQLLALMSVGYLITENITYGVILLVLWAAIKYLKLPFNKEF